MLEQELETKQQRRLAAAAGKWGRGVIRRQRIGIVGMEEKWEGSCTEGQASQWGRACDRWFRHRVQGKWKGGQTQEHVDTVGGWGGKATGRATGGVGQATGGEESGDLTPLSLWQERVEEGRAE